MRARKTTIALVAAVLAVASAGAAMAAGLDFGASREAAINAERAEDLFGVERGLAASSKVDFTPAQALANPLGMITVAKGLKARVVTAGNAGSALDQMVLWPKARPTHIIACDEENTATTLQKIDLKTGVATTIASGLIACDPVRETPWGTVLFGTESGSAGAMYELIDPLNVVGATVDQTTGASSSPNIRRVDALGFLSFEGLGILPNGVTYYGDEQSAGNGTPGGSYFKFVPTTPWAGSAPITSLDQSPYASGSIYGLRVGAGSNFGQGFSYGRGSWQPIAGAGAQLRPLAIAAKLTGYYRPEDMDIDAKALAAGQAKICMNNTGRDSARYFGETICLTDGPVAGTVSATSVPEVTLFEQGSEELNMPDNIAYQPGRGNWIINEDGSTVGAQGGDRNDDIWSCLPDGADIDSLSDGCIRIATLNDFDAESTGGFFDPSGKTYYVSIQHNSSGFGTIVAITGWQ